MVKTKNLETNWYSVKVQNNYEAKVADRILLEFERLGKDIKIIIPKERLVSSKNGKKVFKEKILYPGYIFVETLLVGELMGIVRATTGATSVLKGREDGKATPLRKHEVERMLNEAKVIQEPISEDIYAIGQHVNVLTGPFVDLLATVEEFDSEKQTIKVSVLVFKKKVYMDLTYDDITKIK